MALVITTSIDPNDPLEAVISIREARRPRLGFIDLNVYRHVDAMGRETTNLKSDRDIAPDSGKLSKLLVSATDKVLESPKGTTWFRTPIRNVAPTGYRLALWPLDHIDQEVEVKQWSSEQWRKVVLKWIPASLGIASVVSSCS